MDIKLFSIIYASRTKFTFFSAVLYGTVPYGMIFGRLRRSKADYHGTHTINIMHRVSYGTRTVFGTNYDSAHTLNMNTESAPKCQLPDFQLLRLAFICFCCCWILSLGRSRDEFSSRRSVGFAPGSLDARFYVPCWLLSVWYHAAFIYCRCHLSSPHSPLPGPNMRTPLAQVPRYPC
jgi:hypothetical protein